MLLLITHIILGLFALLGFATSSIKILSEGEAGKLLEYSWYMYTLSVILGAFQAKLLYDHYWVWDIKEIFSLLTILCFLLYMGIEPKLPKLHRKIIVLLCLSISIITLIIPQLIISYH